MVQLILSFEATTIMICHIFIILKELQFLLNKYLVLPVSQKLLKYF